jgi:glycosyltransferase involved in cell wall biosynthesis
MKRSGEVLRVCLDARLEEGLQGGVEQFVIGLASAFSKLTGGNEEYVFLTYGDANEWILPYIQGSCQILPGSAAPKRPRWKELVKSAMPFVVSAWRKRPQVRGGRAIKLPSTDGTIERNGIDLIHFTNQNAFLTGVPSIYHPWDLQHLHLPQFFNPGERWRREVAYRTFCEQARMVAVASSWTKRDLMNHYKLGEEKVKVVPVPPVVYAYPTPSDGNLDLVRQKYSLPETFVFYPAQTWPHKNHIGLLEALAILRDRHGLRVPLVCSGTVNSFFPKIRRRTRELRLADHVRFVGFVSSLELQCLYRLCRCMVFPSKFEGWGMPLTEAFLIGVPVACSNATSLSDLAGDAALIFDPDRPEEIAEAIRRLWTEEALRNTLVEQGKKNVARFSWDRTARMFRAHYRQIAGRPLTEEDRALLAAPPLL